MGLQAPGDPTSRGSPPPGREPGGGWPARKQILNQAQWTLGEGDRRGLGALEGGGGNFGVATRLGSRLHPVEAGSVALPSPR